MTQLEAALAGIVAFLENRRVSYAVVGGFANLIWGKPRLTQDVDVEIRLAEPDLASFIAALSGDYEILVADPVVFATELRVLPVATRNGVRIDLMIASHVYEEELVRRAVEIENAGRRVRYCTPEDLILLKLVSERPRDREDIEGVFARQGAKLDVEYLRTRVGELAAGLERPDLADFTEGCFSKYVAKP